MSGLTIPFTGLKKQYNNLRQEILDATDEVLRSGQLMNGNHTAEFENWLAKRNHSKYAVTCHSGTHALEIIASYYREAHVVNPPRVLIPTMTYAATANAFIRAGWDVHFIDTDRYGILNPETIPDVSYQALVLIGLYGSRIDTLIEQYKRWPMKSIDTNTIWIEDGAQHWLSDRGQRCGNATAISFDPMKNLNAYGNGGAVVTDDLNLMEYARAWRDNGKSQHQLVGTNSRMSEIDCAQMMVKTRYLDAWQQRRQTIATYWIERLKKSSVRCLIDDKNFEGHAFHKFVIEVDNRDILQKNLAVKKIETRIHYREPLHELGVFRQYPGPDILCNSSALARRVLSLPFYPELTDLEVEYVIDQLLDLVN
jgi:dTDP-4-amino-4,6-dideoxygalactose transaminase